MKYNYGDPIDFELMLGVKVKGTVVGLAAGNYLALYNGNVWAVPRAEEAASVCRTPEDCDQPMLGNCQDCPFDVYDEFEQADWGDGSLSPEAEERKAALNRGRP